MWSGLGVAALVGLAGWVGASLWVKRGVAEPRFDRVTVDDAEQLTSPGCAKVQGFSLHADGPVAPEHLSENGTNVFTSSAFLLFVKLPGGRAAQAVRRARPTSGSRCTS